MPIQPGDTSNVEETSYFTAGSALHKIFKSTARFVNAAIKQHPRKKKELIILFGEFETLLRHWYDTMIITIL